MVLKNIRLIDPATNTDRISDIEIKNGVITSIAEAGKKDYSSTEYSDRMIFNGTGLVAAPGLVDVHVHFRDPGFEYKEDIYTGAMAAAKGGFTSVVMMANTKPVVDNEETLNYVLGKSKKTNINVYSCASITKGLQGKELTDMDKLKDLGAVGFTDDGIPIKDVAVVKEAMNKAAKLGMPLSFHEEEPQFISENGINADIAAPALGIKGSPRMAEISLIERDLEIAKDIPADIVVQHISSAEGVELVRQAKKTNEHVHAEVTPHHFTLTETAVIKKGTLAKMNPPLRTEADRQALIAGLKDGTIDIISTDHAPHSTEEKNRPLTEAPSGIIGLETSLGLGVRELVEPGYLTLMELIEKMSTNPAKLYGLNAGRLYEGGTADLVIFGPGKTWFVQEDYVSKSSNTPFTGETLPGKVYMTICAGKIVYQS